MRVRCSEINWDAPSENEGKLPRAMTLIIPPLRENEDQESLTDELAEKLANETGFSVLSFNHRILKK